MVRDTWYKIYFLLKENQFGTKIMVLEIFLKSVSHQIWKYTQK